MAWNTSIPFPAAQNLFSSNIYGARISSTRIWSGNVTIGYNLINISSTILHRRGSMLQFRTSERVATNTSSGAAYRDFNWIGALYLPFNQNLLVKVFTKEAPASGQATKTNSLTHTYVNPGSYGLSVWFQCNNSLYQASINVTATPKSDFLILECSSLTQQLNCTMTAASSCSNAQLYLQYSDAVNLLPSWKENFTMPSSSQLPTTALNVNRSFANTGTFSLVSMLVCNNLTVPSIQQIVTVTNGQVSRIIGSRIKCELSVPVNQKNVQVTEKCELVIN